METTTAASEFPDRLGAVVVRDLRQGLRASYFVWSFIILQILALLATLIEWALLSTVGATFGGLTSPIFLIFLGLVFTFLLPLTQFGALQGELGQGRNIELLLTSQLSRWQILRGKFSVAGSLSGLLLVSLLPYHLIRYFLGGVELVETLKMTGGAYVENLTMNAIVIGASGFANYVGRLAVIFFVGLISLGTMSFTMASGLTGASPVIALLAGVPVTLTFIVLGLQLGRARLRPFLRTSDAPFSLGILVFILAIPVIAGVSFAAGGVVAWAVTACGLLFLGLVIDGDKVGKKRLKGLQP